MYHYTPADCDYHHLPAHLNLTAEVWCSATAAPDSGLNEPVELEKLPDTIVDERTECSVVLGDVERLVDGYLVHLSSEQEKGLYCRTRFGWISA